ncbi:M23 family metallopeptidase [Candidatus Kaiserbacteria bacterium]|nr:M23 family metallopeptidase [Candidatus Kaiserbacteria bacterium]
MRRITVSLISLLLVVGSVIPAIAHASVLSFLRASIRGNTAEAETVSGSGNVQTMSLLKPATNLDPSPNRGGGDITIVDDTALLPEDGPAGTIADIEKPKNSTISVYVVREGDTLSEIAGLFDVSPNTILWANDLPRGSSLKVGQKLTILPVTGVRYTIKKGDTLASVAKKHGADAAEIASYNGLDESGLTVGAVLIIPNGEIAAAPTPKPILSRVVTVSTSVRSGYYMAPLARYVKTQGIHGYNGIDLAAPVGTPIMVSAAGDVIVAKETGYNGGYGRYVVIQHDNGSQTLYAHQSNVIVNAGQHVVQGQVIGYVGNSGRSTGAHLHFEIRNGIRNPF